MSLHDDWLVVSAPYDDDAGMESGAAYIYQRAGGSWLLKAKQLPMEEPTDLNEFSFGVGASRDFFVVISKHSDAGNEGGAFGNVYVYETYEPGAPTAVPRSAARASVFGSRTPMSTDIMTPTAPATRAL